MIYLGKKELKFIGSMMAMKNKLILFLLIMIIPLFAQTEVMKDTTYVSIDDGNFPLIKDKISECLATFGNDQAIKKQELFSFISSKYNLPNNSELLININKRIVTVIYDKVIESQQSKDKELNIDNINLFKEIKMIQYVVVGLLVLFILSGIRIVRPTHRGLIERMGNYRKFAKPGFNWIIPVIDRMIKVNTTEQMIDAQPQEIITNDNLNATVDAQVYFKIKADEDNVKNSQYNVQDYSEQIVSLARTTLRNIIGTLTLKSANSERDKINGELLTTLSKETGSWGIDVVRTELKEIEPPEDVQDTMNKVVKAENENIAALNFANAKEREADGAKRVEIKKAEGIKQAKVLQAEGDAEAIKLVNGAANKYFVGNAQLLRRLEAIEKSLQNNAKIVVPSDSDLINVVGEMAGVLPIKDKKNKKKNE